MKNIFVFTASDQSSKKHMKDTIENQIPSEKVEKHFTAPDLVRVKEIGRKNGYFAWRALPGSGNIRTWSKMQIGDHILVYQNGNYTYYSEVLFKARNTEFALENWGKSREGETWEYMYLLKKPIKLDPPIKSSELSKYLTKAYRGFRRLSAERMGKIVKDYGSIENYLEEVLPKVKLNHLEPHIFWWVNQGKSYTEEGGKKFLWAPKEGKDKTIPKHWKNIELVRKGDVIFNYANGSIRAISITKESGHNYRNEDSKEWNKDGTRVDFEHYPIDPISKLKIKPHKKRLQKALENINGPFDKDGNIKQRYLFEFNFKAAKVIREIYGQPFPEPIERYFVQEKKHKDWIIDLLQKKGQIIIYGPPGTGKTFSTKKYCLRLLGHD